MKGSLRQQLSELHDGSDSQRLNALLGEDVETRPAFAASWVVPAVPHNAVAVASYTVEGCPVTIYNLADRVESLYHLAPPEYGLPAAVVALIEGARDRLLDDPPRDIASWSDVEVRQDVVRRGESLVLRLARERGIPLGASREDQLERQRRLGAHLARYTVGLGVCELLLRDPHVQDVYADAPVGTTPVHVNLADIEGAHGRCVTNIYLTTPDAEALLTRLLLASGRPFSDALPVLEANLEAHGVRATAVGGSLSPDGLAFAFRRHSAEPWTLPRLIARGSLTPLAAGLLSLLIDGRSTILVAGSRGAGKSSLLGALLLELPQAQRILTIEDTPELPVRALQARGYKVQGLVVQSFLGGSEMTAEEALRVSLRLGESAIVLGEVRGREARTLYEAMRAGTAGSTVLGTIHGNSSTAVYERIVHDLGIPPMSFQATDIIVVAGLARPGGKQRVTRRVLEVTELAKDRGPGAFDPLLEYDADRDALVDTQTLRTGSGRLREIAASWGVTEGDLHRGLRNRAECRRLQVDAGRDRTEVLGSRWTARCNAQYASLVESGLQGHALVTAWRGWFGGALRG